MYTWLYVYLPNLYEKSLTAEWRPIGLLDVEAPTFFVDSWLTESSEIVTLTYRPPVTPRKIPDGHSS
jgi:hypothetical protein